MIRMIPRNLEIEYRDAVRMVFAVCLAYNGRAVINFNNLITDGKVRGGDPANVLDPERVLIGRLDCLLLPGL